MANEITKVELFGQNNDGDGSRLTITSSAVVTKGTLMNLSDPRTTTAALTPGEAIGGIAGMGKEADYSTSITLWENGEFEGRASGAIVTGAELYSASSSDFPNYLAKSAGVASVSGAAIVGYATKDAADLGLVTFRRRGIGG